MKYKYILTQSTQRNEMLSGKNKRFEIFKDGNKVCELYFRPSFFTCVMLEMIVMKWVKEIFISQVTFHNRLFYKWYAFEKKNGILFNIASWITRSHRRVQIKVKYMHLPCIWWNIFTDLANAKVIICRIHIITETMNMHLI